MIFQCESESQLRSMPGGGYSRTVILPLKGQSVQGRKTSPVMEATDALWKKGFWRRPERK